MDDKKWTPPVKASASYTQPEYSGIYQCPICKWRPSVAMTFTSLDNLLLHVATIHRQTACPFCGLMMHPLLLRPTDAYVGTLIHFITCEKITEMQAIAALDGADYETYEVSNSIPQWKSSGHCYVR